MAYYLWSVILLFLCASAVFYALVQKRKYKALCRALKISEGQRPETGNLRLYDEQLVQAQKLEALGHLAGGIAHDFNNVLAIIDGYLHMAAQTVPEGQDKLAGYLERIKNASRRGAGLTRQLLLFGRHGAGHKKVVNIAAIVREQEALLQPLLDSGIIMKVDVAPDLFINCAPDGLAQIIMNLVLNARDAMPEGGEINIEAQRCAAEKLPPIIPPASRRKAFICFSVSDTGVGMDEKIISRIFDPFYSTKEQGRGTGLGLSMVYGLVQEMGGYIDVEAQPGEGTAMRLYLPCSAGEANDAAACEENFSHIRFDGYTALVAEDEPDLLKLICVMLEERGMEILPATNGAEALDLQEHYKGDIDFLISDVVMPHLNGARLAELVKAARDETNVIFMSGYPADGRLAQVNIPEEAVMLAKPVQANQMITALYHMLDEEEVAMQ